MDIKEFLLARIAEDEAVAVDAKGATGAEWVAHGSLLMHVDDSESRLAEPVGAVEDYRMDPTWKHVERHDPARVLRECAAKRAIMDAHPIVDDVVEVSTRIKWGFACETCFSYGDIVEDNGYCDTLRALAAVHSDHPDYQQEWSL